jgi:alpha-D-ribose 1-methylphosphonate 5-triphosphate diphosphatase
MVYARLSEERERRPFTIASHDDDSPEKVRALHGLGAAITEFPVDVDAARAAKDLGMWSIVGAPNIVRGGSSSGNQSAAELFSLGLADVICADYHSPSMLPAAFRLVDDGIADLPAAIRALTLNPARAVGLTHRGAIEPGCSADVIVVRREGRGIPMVERVLRGGAEVFSLQIPRGSEVPA